MTPMREAVLERLATVLGAIRAPTIQDFESGSVVGLTDEEESAEIFQDSTKLTMLIRVEKLLRTNNPAKRATSANTALAELIQSLHTAAHDAEVAALIEHIEYSTGGVFYPPEESNIVGAYVQANVMYWMDTGDPFNYTAFED